MSLEMTDNEFARWLEQSLPNSQVIYHRGNLAWDRAGKLVYEGDAVRQVPTVFSEAVDYVAATAWQAMENRYVLLTQSKVGEARFDYVAIRTGVSIPASRTP